MLHNHHFHAFLHPHLYNLALYGKFFSESVSVQATNEIVNMDVKLPSLFGSSKLKRAQTHINMDD
jgi:hypothetical protein